MFKALKAWFDNMRRRFSGYYGGGTVVIPPPPPPLAAPINSSLPVITGSAVKGQTLSVSTGAWINPTPGLTYDWKRGGVSIVGATSSTYVLVTADIGSVITCAVTASNAAGSATAISAGTSTVIDLAPVNTVLPAITGTPTEGQTLSVSNGTWINTPISYTRQWLRNGSAIGGATGTTYLLVTADVGGNISCTVTATNSGGSAPATSASVGPIGGATATPHNTVLPVLTGAAIVRGTLFTDNGSWDITPTSFTYQWYDASGAISGETGDTYLIVDADVGKQIHCAVTAYNIAAASSPASSLATSAVAAMSAASGITLIARTSASGVTPPVIQHTFDLAKVLPLDVVRVRESTDGTFSGADIIQNVVHFLTSTDLAGGAVVLDFVTDGFTTPGATNFLDYTLEMTSPHGVFLNYTYPTIFSPTDAVSPMTWSSSDRASGTAVANGNLTLRASSPATSGRTNRGISSGKVYFEGIYRGLTAGLFDAAADLTTAYGTVANGRTESVHAAVWDMPNSTGSFNATNFSVAGISSAQFSAGFSGTTMTVSLVNSGTLAVGQYLAGPGIPWGTKITGGSGVTWTVNNSLSLADQPNLAAGPIISIALDKTNNLVWFAKDNSWQNSGNPSAGTGGLSISGISSPVYPAFTGDNGSIAILNPGTTPGGTAGFVFTPPTGFVAP